MQAARFNHVSVHATADALQATLYLEKAEL